MRKFKLHVLVIFSIFLILILTNYKINLNASVNNDSKIEQEKLDSDNKSKEESQVSKIHYLKKTQFNPMI